MTAAPLFLPITEPITWPADDPYSDRETFRAHERFWWHEEITRELLRLREINYPAGNVEMLASNICRGAWDTTKNIRMMLAWGELERAEPLWDFEPDTWVRVSDAELERRGVRITPLEAGVQHLVACGSCEHFQVVRGPKAAAEEAARYHRQQHRSSR